MAEVILEKVVKRFGNQVVVDDVSIEVHDGEFMVLVGPSGCGKTTTLRMIAGLEQMSGGVISIGGRRVNELSPRDRDIAMVFQNYALYSHLNVHDNLAFALRARKVSRADAERRIDEVAEMLELKPLLKRQPRQLSGGQRQRVALGRAIVREPKAFLMDEPLSNLDAILRLQMRKELIELTSRLQSTVVYVTHDQVEAMTMGHRMAVMRDGKLLQVGTPAEVYAKPITRFVAGFIGTPPMNMVRCETRQDGGIRFLQGGGARFDATLGALGERSTVDVGVRPGDFAICRDDAGFAADVTVVENLGGELLIYADADHQTISFLGPVESGIRTGDHVRLQARPDRVHLFDPESGSRLN